MHISIFIFLALSLKIERFLAQLVAEGAKDSAEEYLDGHGARETGRRFKPWCERKILTNVRDH
jgi:hypothetical protein